MGYENINMLNCLNQMGKMRRFNKIFKNDGKALIVPLDDSLISYSHKGLQNLDKKIVEIQKAKPDGILCYYGTASLINDFDIPLIYNITASTVNSTPTNKVLISQIEDAVKLDATAVAVHINISSDYESEMLKIVGKASSLCNDYGIPLLVITYPRKETKNGVENYNILKKEDPEKYTKLVAHCVRIAFELGADIIKTQYTGSTESFREVINAAVNRPVLIAGGEFVDETTILEIVRGAIKAGAAGVSIGRNVFNRNNANHIIENIKSIIWGDKI